jgi:tRNA-2-methylthio-N6-dimethylallyladenosine synthase
MGRIGNFAGMHPTDPAPGARDAAPAPEKTFYIESYGCQMNFSDSEIVASVLAGKGYALTTDAHRADVVLLNTCAIRENAELRVRQRLQDFKARKKQSPGLVVGLLGCMAERLKTKLLEEEQLVDLVAGPDAYRDIPRLIETVGGGQKAVNVLLSREETYADISPVRLGKNGVSAFISIMRGCDNMCTFCVVPFTRGRERSRDPQSVVAEAERLYGDGYREITLLGQNVDSYLWHPGTNSKKAIRREGMTGALDFAGLLARVAAVHPDLRIRFSTSNPGDMTDAVLHVMAAHDNICKYIHLPVQSGSSGVLDRMKRGYAREDYLRRVDAIRRILPGCGLSTDIIAGFCGETEEDHRATLSLMEEVRFDFAYMFAYSERPGTAAARQLPDDVPAETKARRLREIVDLQMRHGALSNERDLHRVHRVLVEGPSRKSDGHLAGRNTQNKVVVFPKRDFTPGRYVDVLVTRCTAATLLGEAVADPVPA